MRHSPSHRVALGALVVGFVAAALLARALAPRDDRAPTPAAAAAPRAPEPAPGDHGATPPGGSAASSPGPAGAPAAPAPTTLAVRVVDEASGAPLARARVAARRPGAGGPPAATGETDARGRAALAAPDGPLEVVAVAEGYLVPAPVAAPAPGAPTAAAGTREVEVRLRAGARVAGRVALEPGAARPADLEVALEGAGPEFVGALDGVRPGPDGAFVVPGVPPGAGYALLARARGWTDARAALPPVGPAGLDGVVLRLRRLRIAGEVVGAPGGPSLGAAVAVELVPPSALEGATDRRVEAPGGRFDAPVVGPGRWTLRAVQEGAASPWAVVEVDPAGAPPPVRLVLAPAAGLVVRVLGPDDAPVVGASVVARDPGGQTWRAEADTDGRVALEATTGDPLDVTCAAPGLAPVRRLAQAPASLVVRLAPLVPVAATPFVGPDGRPLAGGLVVDPGDPDPHADDLPLSSFEVEFDAAGRPRLDGLPPGRWTVSFPEPAEGELRAWVLDVDAAPGAPVALAFDGSAPRGRLAGRVRGAPLGGDLVQVDVRPREAPTGAFGFLAARPAGPDGAFELPAVPPGRYVVRAVWDGGRTGDVEVEVRAGAQAWAELAAE